MPTPKTSWKGRPGGANAPLRGGIPYIKTMQRNLKWTVILLAFCIVLALLGSVNVGHAALGGKSQANTKQAPNSRQNGNTASLPGKSSAPTAIVQHQTPTSSPSRPRPTPTRSTPTQSSAATPTPSSARPPVSTPTQSQAGPPISARPQTPIQAPDTTQVANPNTSSILVQDTFARQNQITWGSTRDGHAWQSAAALSNIFSISNHQGKVAQANGYFDAIIGPRISNESIKATGIINFAQSDGTTSIGLVLRWQNSNNWYKAYLDGQTIGIRKRVNGQTTDLAKHQFFVQSGVPYTIRFHILEQSNGTLLEAKAWPSNLPEPQQWTLHNIHDTDPVLSSGFGGLRIGVQDETAVYITSFTEKRL